MLTRSDLIADVEEYDSDWNVHHYYMLLRELLVERSSNLEGIAYYLDWLIDKSVGCSSETALLFLAAINNRPSEIEADISTAYRCFFQLARTSNIASILQQATTWQGVTAHGIELAGMLLGPYAVRNGISLEEVYQ
ncbi:Hypothetical protein POVR2_LOCUS236 [uncultured virus]|nr:Hypothetical protein POVR2_LOCUS236 [uncultured virus]